MLKVSKLREETVQLVLCHTQVIPFFVCAVSSGGFLRTRTVSVQHCLQHPQRLVLHRATLTQHGPELHKSMGTGRTMEAATLTFHIALLILNELPAAELKMQTHTWEPLKSFLLLG